MQARRCGGCGAPLRDSEDGERPICAFCGMVHDPTAVAVHHVAIESPLARRNASTAVAIISVVFLVAVLAPLAFIFVQWRTANAIATRLTPLPAMPPSVPTPGVSPSPFKPRVAKKLSVRELRDLPRGHHELDVAPPPGGYAAVDAVTTLPWALSIAQAWLQDARLERIDVDRMRPDGTVNAADDAAAKVQYRFVSPGQNEELLRRAELSAKAEVNTGLWVVLSDGRPQVYVNYTTAPLVRTERRGPLPGHPVALPLATLLTRPGVQQALRPVPFYDGYLIHIQGEGWVWYFSTLANETFPRVRARDGASFPYGR